MTSNLAQAIIDNLKDEEIENMVGNYFGNQLFSVVSTAANVTEETRAAELVKINDIINSPVVAAMSEQGQQRIKDLCEDVKEMVSMDPNAED